MPITAVTDLTLGYASNPVQSEAEPAAFTAKLGDEESGGQQRAGRHKRKAGVKSARIQSKEAGPAEPGKGDQIDVSG